MKYRTVLCEDNPYVSEVINYILEERGHEVHLFEDAADCPLSSLTECKCNHMDSCSDIIISDISMPVVNGLDFIETLREKGCKNKNIAMVSAYWTKENLARAKKLGCTVFYKPIRPTELHEWLDNCEKNIDPQRVLSKKLP
jgi:CheY-like chemotaxis protein